MRIFGLTGKTGSGKSTVAALLAEKGWFVIDGDALAREVTKSGSPVLQKLAEVFGGDILSESGELDRKELVRRVTAQPDGVDKLNAATHPAIDELMRRELQKGDEAGYTHCVIDAAALLESPSRALCEQIIVVTADEETRLARILSRDGLSSEQAKERMRMQKSDAYYASQADILLENSSAESLQTALRKLEEL